MDYTSIIRSQAPLGRKQGLSKGILAGGAFAGFISGTVTGFLALLFSWASGMGLFLPAKAVAAAWIGLDALVGGGGVVILGMLTHLAVSAALGVVFASLVNEKTPASTAFWNGVTYGIAVWIVMTFIVTPLFDMTLRERVALTPGRWFFLHLLYGGLLMAVPAFRRAFAKPSVLERPTPPKVKITV